MSSLKGFRGLQRSTISTFGVRKLAALDLELLTFLACISCAKGRSTQSELQHHVNESHRAQNLTFVLLLFVLYHYLT